MKHLLTPFILFLLLFSTSAQISVKSFHKLESDMTARIDAKKIDQNGDVCAIIKVVTTQTGFFFDCGTIGIVATVNKPSEIWVYVPFGTKRITISHPKLGLLRDYMFAQPIEKATVYELVLVSGRVETTVVEEINSHWLLINPTPADAAVYIDDVFVKTGIYQSKLKIGTYTYRVEAPLYHTEAGKIELSDGKKELNLILKPAYGFIHVTSEPETDARVLIDGKSMKTNTPYQSEALASGEHNLQVLKEMYQPFNGKIMVADGMVTTVRIPLQPTFATLTINAPKNATLYVNNQDKGKGKWTGRLGAGVYSLEARMDKHRTDLQDVELVVGASKEINLEPTPLYGSLDVMTTPPGANIVIDGIDCGNTPNTVNKLLIGDYQLKLSLNGYKTIHKTITVSENKSIELLETFRATDVSENKILDDLTLEEQLDSINVLIVRSDEIENDSLKSVLYYAKGILNCALQKKEDAFNAFDIGLDYNPKNLSILNDYAYYLAVDKGNFSKAWEMSRKTVEAEPKNSQYLDTFAWIYYLSKKYDNAYLYMQSAIENLPEENTNGIYYDHLGDIMWFKTYYDTAVKMWQKAADMGYQSDVLNDKLKFRKWRE